MEYSIDHPTEESVKMFIRAHDDLFQKQLVSVGRELYVTPVENASCEFELEPIQRPDNVSKSSFPTSPLKLGFHRDSLTYFVSRALQSMNVSEKARFSFQYESKLLLIELHLISFDLKEDVFQWPKEDRLSFCMALKNFGNDLFKEKNFMWAFHHYHRSLLFYTSASDDVDEKLKDLKKKSFFAIISYFF